MHRCKDDAGKLTYSDRPCDSGQLGRLIERKKSADEIYSERLGAYNAELDKQERNMRAAEQKQIENMRRLPVAGSPIRSAPQQKGFAQRLAERNATVVSIFPPRAVEAQKRPSSYPLPAVQDNDNEDDSPRSRQRNDNEDDSPRSRQPISLSSCASGFCHDNKGQVYNQVSPDLITGPKGRPCHRNGDMWNCN